MRGRDFVTSRSSLGARLWPMKASEARAQGTGRRAYETGNAARGSRLRTAEERELTQGKPER